MSLAATMGYATPSMLLAAVLLWLACGLMPGGVPIIIATIVSSLCVCTLVAAGMFWRNRA